MNSSQWNLSNPEWEVLDPTPNVHALFVQFNSKFFWGKLGSVSVRWSKRMYSCAGICRYEGRGGLCDIGLSEPLLKLRPRKDLVETLLHEMIHAFLFLTQRDRDRDGHGPNFQQHMHRINREANVHITIYHDFHDEVRLYKTHWWRCDGPCQSRKPFFGLVKRTSNRAPAPSDSWWSQHQASCGGKFIKIKEPENTRKPSVKPNKENINGVAVKPHIITIADLPTTSSAGTKMNGNKTVVVTNTSDTNATPKNRRKTLTDFWGKGNTFVIGPKKQNSDAALTVRNHWANKDLTSQSKVLKRHSTIETSGLETPPLKITKMNNTLAEVSVKPPVHFTLDDATALLKDIYGDSFTLNKVKYENKFSPPKPKSSTSDISSQFDKTSLNDNGASSVKNEIKEEPLITEVVDCPSCNEKVNSSEINDHLDICTTIKKLIECSDCHEKVESLESHAEKCSKKTPDFVECPTCQEIVSNINDHLDKCLKDNETVSCPSCQKKITQSELNVHLDVCLTQQQIIEDATVHNCPICNKEVTGSLEDHIELCFAGMDKGTITENGSISLVDDEDDFNDSSTHNASGTMLPCPCCMKMVEAAEMNNHIDKCLNLV